MNLWVNRIAGTIMVVTAIIGLLFSIVGIAFVWRFKSFANDRLVENLSIASGMIDTTAQGLLIADQSIEDSITSLEGLKTTVDATAVTIRDTTPMVNTLATLMAEDLPFALESARTSLDSAQESARIIDSVLGALSVLPGINYNPPVPLNEALAEVSASIAGLPESLETIEDSLTTASSRAEDLETDVQRIAQDIDEISGSLEEARGVVSDYSDIVLALQARIDRLEPRLPGMVNSTAIIFTFLLIWAAVSQLGLLLQGLALIQNRPYAHVPAAPGYEDIR